MLSLQDVTIARGANVLIEKINLSVFPKHIIGMVGDNGCGKTSLFSVILGLLETARGEILLSKNLKIVSLEQEVPALDMSALDYVISGNTVLFDTFQKLKSAEEKEDYDALMQCHTVLHEINGYGAESIASKILKGLGFSQEEMQKPVKTFSGGWRMRLNLAKCLFAPSELLLLDEPTNHLDMETILWLEAFLKNYSGAVLMISHDRDFLDDTVTHIAHIENKNLKLYSGNYSQFEILRAQYIALQNAQHKKQQSKIAHMKKFVDRFRASATKAKQAQSRLKAIEKMEIIAPLYESSPFQFHFLKPDRMPNPMITMRKVDLGYDNHVVLRRVDLGILAGQRIGLLGVNGAGKSTLIKSICGELTPMQGDIVRPPSLNIGYFAQHQVDYLPLELSSLELLKKLNNTKTEKELISYLASFGFSRDQSLAPLGQFSGGEKSRVALALIIWRRPNLLLLDEPTNHLDLSIRQALVFALEEYEGAMVLVSHDRYLMRTLVDELYFIEKGKLNRFEGTVQDYQEMSLNA
ncbi:MAG: ABC transporter ATP-binding protein [Gammaproteobacteria bacterium RIFCSPLOWO2_12_FULL_38_14]|nr:MAG: ABC transporter ATP-binding protein [Gammaproteobacteria bacterium RIFCSPHIGHO2_12_38_15]OGT76865.1 MAG: ABC transporter ATP-binding protein [Gammaproteobacteria bacterium RIFCSPLOWO2_12_FULL_38_14]